MVPLLPVARCDRGLLSARDASAVRLSVQHLSGMRTQLEPHGDEKSLG